MNLETYRQAVKSGITPGEPITGLCGRIIRGRKPEDFLTLTEDPENRKFVILGGPDGLAQLIGQSDFQKLRTIGWDHDYAIEKIRAGYQMKLVVFLEGGEKQLATWDNLPYVLEGRYPDAAAALRLHLPALKAIGMNFEHYEREAGFIFSEVNLLGGADPRYMTYERFLRSTRSLIDTRAFLYFTVHLRNLYAGDGWTREVKDGPRILMEYLVPNVAIADLGEHIIIDLNCQVPVETGGPNVLTKPKVADHAPLIYTPSFWGPEKAYEDYRPDIESAFHEGVQLAQDRRLAPAKKLMEVGIAHAAMLTDLQEDFRPGRRLPVAGTDDVVLRVCTRLLNGTVEDYFTGLILSQDGHPPFHVSYDVVWRDQHGKALDLSQRKAAILTLEDRTKAVFKCIGFTPDGGTEVIGYYQRIFDPRDAVEYWDHLQKTGQGDIWVFAVHCQLGTDGVNQHPLVNEVVAFMCGARSIQPTFIFKGHIANTDWFGPLRPCRPDPSHPQGGFQKDVVDDMKRFRTIEFSGVAEDFCDYYMKQQTLEALVGTEYIGRLRFVSDCTAPIIPKAPQVTALNKEALAQGVKFINHDTPFSRSI